MSKKVEYTSASEIRNLRNLHIPMSLESIFKYEETLSEKLMEDDSCYFFPESQKYDGSSIMSSSITFVPYEKDKDNLPPDLLG